MTFAPNQPKQRHGLEFMSFIGEVLGLPPIMCVCNLALFLRVNNIYDVWANAFSEIKVYWRPETDNDLVFILTSEQASE